MIKTDVGTLSVAELVDEFVALAIKQYMAVWDGDTKAYNPLFDRMEAIKAELKNRPGDRRNVLKTLYDHPNVQVRLMAARSTLALAPIEARDVVESIAASGQFPTRAMPVCVFGPSMREHLNRNSWRAERLSMLDGGSFLPE
jgi:hypothetical protein